MNIALCAGTPTLALGHGQSLVEGGAAGGAAGGRGAGGRGAAGRGAAGRGAAASASNQCGGQESSAFVRELPQRRHILGKSAVRVVGLSRVCAYQVPSGTRVPGYRVPYSTVL